MKNLAPGVWRLDEFPRPLINVYLAEDVVKSKLTMKDGRVTLPDGAGFGLVVDEGEDSADVQLDAHGSGLSWCTVHRFRQLRSND